ncbi:MAG: zinc-binding alcohol dehydrogenase family protein [Chitinophagaceae bacterium]|nr:zinc-binding alcohol dehydrogenase family protein [Chitinophagaceae bacterium]
MKRTVLSCIQPGEWKFYEEDLPSLKQGEALLKIKKVGICGTDIHAFGGTQPYFNYPRILGHEIAAEVLEVSGHGTIEKGDLVTVIPYLNCGTCLACRTGKPNCCSSINVIGVHSDGAFATHLIVPSKALLKASGLNTTQLALVEPLAIGAHGVRRANVKEGEWVLVMGAGPIGIAAIEFAKIAGAKIAVIDFNEERLHFCRESLKVDAIINPSTEDVVTNITNLTGGDMMEVVIDATGSKKAMEAAVAYLGHGGRIVLIGLQKESLLYSHPEFHKRETTPMSSRNATQEDFDWVLQNLANGTIKPENYVTGVILFAQVPDHFTKISGIKTLIDVS